CEVAAARTFAELLVAGGGGVGCRERLCTACPVASRRRHRRGRGATGGFLPGIRPLCETAPRFCYRGDRRRDLARPRRFLRARRRGRGLVGPPVRRRRGPPRAQGLAVRLSRG